MPAPTTIQKLQFIHKFACSNAPDLSFDITIQPLGLRIRAWADSRHPAFNRMLTWEELDTAPRAAIEHAIIDTFKAAKNAVKPHTPATA